MLSGNYLLKIIRNDISNSTDHTVDNNRLLSEEIQILLLYINSWVFGDELLLRKILFG
jgi:hypothetical protein